MRFIRRECADADPYSNADETADRHTHEDSHPNDTVNADKNTHAPAHQYTDADQKTYIDPHPNTNADKTADRHTDQKSYPDANNTVNADENTHAPSSSPSSHQTYSYLHRARHILHHTVECIGRRNQLRRENR